MKPQKFTYRTLSQMSNENLLAILANEKLEGEEALALARLMEKRFPSTMSTKQTAQYVGLSCQKVYRHVYNATIPYMDNNRGYGFYKWELDEYFLNDRRDNAARA